MRFCYAFTKKQIHPEYNYDLTTKNDYQKAVGILKNDGWIISPYKVAVEKWNVDNWIISINIISSNLITNIWIISDLKNLANRYPDWLNLVFYGGVYGQRPHFFRIGLAMQQFPWYLN